MTVRFRDRGRSVPPPLPPPDRRWHLALLGIGLVLLLVVTASGWYVSEQIAARQRAEAEQDRQRAAAQAASQAQLCPDLDRTADEAPDDRFALHKAGTECVGWTIGRDYPFAANQPEIADLISKIVQQNREVATGARAYRRIAVLMPMTGNATTMVPPAPILNALRGVLAAQARLNDPTVTTLGTTQLAFQVVLANSGSSGQSGLAVARDLEPLATGDRDHPLIAVIGLGASKPITRAVADQLGRAGIPVIGAVLSGSNMTAGNRFFKVSPSNVEYMSALRGYVDRHPELKSAFLVYDSRWEIDGEPTYEKTLYDAITAEFDGKPGDRPGGGRRFDLLNNQLSFTGSNDAGGTAANLFTRASDDIVCHNRSDLVFFSGRQRDLPTFIQSLAGIRTCGEHQPLTVATGTVGPDTLTDPQFVALLQQARITVIDAASTDYPGWSAGVRTPPGYRDFETYYRDTLHLPVDGLADGYALLHHDALLTAAWAARWDFDDNGQPSALTPGNVGDYIVGLRDSRPVPGASGTFWFSGDPRIGGWSRGKPVPLIEIPARSAPEALPLHLTP